MKKFELRLLLSLALLTSAPAWAMQFGENQGGSAPFSTTFYPYEPTPVGKSPMGAAQENNMYGEYAVPHSIGNEGIDLENPVLDAIFSINLPEIDDALNAVQGKGRVNSSSFEEEPSPALSSKKSRFSKQQPSIMPSDKRSVEQYVQNMLENADASDRTAYIAYLNAVIAQINKNDNEYYTKEDKQYLIALVEIGIAKVHSLQSSFSPSNLGSKWALLSGCQKASTIGIGVFAAIGAINVIKWIFGSNPQPQVEQEQNQNQAQSVGYNDYYGYNNRQ